MLLSLSLACSAVALSLPADTPAEVVGRLQGKPNDRLIEAVVALPPQESLPLLVAVVAHEEGEYAWQAGRALRIIAKESSRDRAWKTETPALGAILIDGQAKSSSRFIAGLSLRGLEKTAKPLFEDIALVLAQHAAPEVHMGATLALSGLGDKALAELKPVLQGEGLLKMMWASTSIACAGKDGKKFKKTLSALVEDEQSFTAYLAHLSNLQALESCAGTKAAIEPRELRASQRRNWAYGGVPYTGMIPNDLRKAVLVLSGYSATPLEEGYEMSLPDLKPESFGDVVTHLCEHVTLETRDLQARLDADEFKRLEQWEQASGGLFKLLDFLGGLRKILPL